MSLIKMMAYVTEYHCNYEDVRIVGDAVRISYALMQKREWVACSINYCRTMAELRTAMGY